jgi:type I restriction enzyme S subunit
VTSKVGSGATPRGGATVYVESGTSFIRSKNVYDHEFHPAGLVHITDDAAHQLRGVTVEAGDVLLNITGDSILRTCMVPPSVLPARVSQHVAIIRSNGQVDPRFMQKWLSLPAMKDFMLGHSSGGTRKAVTKGHILSFPIPLPPIREQQGIAATLGALDDKIASNRRQRELLRLLGKAKLQEATMADSVDVRLVDVSTSLARGVAPKYADDDPMAPLVVNQKCIRGGWVNASLARRMVSRTVAPEKRGRSGDIFVNSTGTGTLGRVGRWHRGEIFVDGHVTIVRPDPSSVHPTVLAYALLDREGDIEAMATGSTGQTELSAARLGDLVVSVPSRLTAGLVEPDLVSFEERIASLLTEEETLVELRNVLLPELLSGRIRVPAAEAPMEAAV